MVDSSEKTILVIGGAGFIGTRTVVQLLNDGFRVSIIDKLDNSVIEAVHRVKELVGPRLSKKLEFNLGDLRNRDDLEKLSLRQSIAANWTYIVTFLVLIVCFLFAMHFVYLDFWYYLKGGIHYDYALTLLEDWVYL